MKTLIKIMLRLKRQVKAFYKQHKRAFKITTSAWFMVSVFVLPAILNLENFNCCLFILANVVGSFLTFKRYNPEYINN